MKRIFLTGYMGSGKSTLGLRLAQKAGLSFIDLDHYIETRFRKTINEIFAEKGEKEFRIIERNMLREVGEFEDVIIATGGGIIKNKENTGKNNYAALFRYFCFGYMEIY